MAIIKTTPGTLEKGLRTEFMRAFDVSGEGARERIQRLATVVPSTAPFEKYEWLGEVPAVKEFLDERDVGDLSQTDFVVNNKTWESTLLVDRNQVMDSRLTGLGIRLTQMAGRAAWHPVKLLYETLRDNGTGYDGVSLFNDAHPARGEQTATQDNLLAGTGVTVSAFKTDLQNAIAQMGTFVDEAGDPFHMMVDPGQLSLIVPPALEFIAREAVEATIIANTSNVLSGIIGEIVVVPGNILTDTNDWYLLNGGGQGGVKALVFQDREPMMFEALESGDEAFMKKVWKYGTFARYNCAPFMWQFAVKTTNA